MRMVDCQLGWFSPQQVTAWVDGDKIHTTHTTGHHLADTFGGKLVSNVNNVKQTCGRIKKNNIQIYWP